MKFSELLDQVLEQTGSQEKRVTEAISGLEAKLNEKTSAHDWSVLGIIHHMVTAHKYYLEAIEEAIASGVQGAEGEIKHTWLGKLLLKINKPGGNFPAPKILRPNDPSYPNEILDEWRSQLRRAAQLAERARGLDLNNSRVRNPFLKPVHQSLGDCFAIMVVHLERHVQQVEAVCAELRAK